MVDWKLLGRSRKLGQGIIEYSGAMIVAGLIVSVLLIGGIGQNSWMYNSYNAIFSAAGNMMLNALNTL